MEIVERLEPHDDRRLGRIDREVKLGRHAGEHGVDVVAIDSPDATLCERSRVRAAMRARAEVAQNRDAERSFPFLAVGEGRRLGVEIRGEAHLGARVSWHGRRSLGLVVHVAHETSTPARPSRARTSSMTPANWSRVGLSSPNFRSPATNARSVTSHQLRAVVAAVEVFEKKALHSRHLHRPVGECRHGVEIDRLPASEPAGFGPIPGFEHKARREHPKLHEPATRAMQQHAGERSLVIGQSPIVLVRIVGQSCGDQTLEGP